MAGLRKGADRYMKKEMLQQVMTAPKKIEFRSVPVPEIGEDQVLVKIMKIGICGSDIHVYHGTHPFTSYPVTQGHELSAKVVKAGKNVTEFTEGQKVTIEPQVYCGTCYPCRHGKIQSVRKAEGNGISDNRNGKRIFCGRCFKGNTFAGKSDL